MSEAMTINDIINQLGSLRASSAEFAKSDPENEIWQADVAACETAIRILAALSGEGCTDLETTLDFLQDYGTAQGNCGPDLQRGQRHGIHRPRPFLLQLH